RRIPESELGWLPGYEGSAPVRVGNAAVTQFQLDVYGELMDVMHIARRAGHDPEPYSWLLERNLMEFLETAWTAPDGGCWVVRGPRKHLTTSKARARAPFDRAVKAVAGFGKGGPAQRWRRLRREVHDEVCRRGFDASRNAFVQYYGATALDASVLMIPL